MPITFAHAPLVALQVLAVMLPLIFGAVAFIVPQFRSWSKRMVFGAIGAIAGMVAYQIAYIPVGLALGAITALIAFMLRYAKYADASNAVAVIGLLLIFYIIWFIVMILGYISGFRIGKAYARGNTFRDSIRTDLFYAAHLKRVALRSK